MTSLLDSFQNQERTRAVLQSDFLLGTNHTTALCILVAFEFNTQRAFLKSIYHKLFKLSKESSQKCPYFPCLWAEITNIEGKYFPLRISAALPRTKLSLRPQRTTETIWNLTGTGFSNTFPEKSHCRWSPIVSHHEARSSGVRFPWCYFKASFNKY